MNDVHNFLNREHIIADLFITTTKPEYEDIAQNYMYDKNAIVCTGLARFDRLKDERKKIILIAPTWRAFLENVEYSNDKENSLEESEFYKKYQSLLNKKEILDEIKKYGYKIQFLLHPASEKYKQSFLRFFPYVGIILNIDADHLDFYKDLNHIKETFKEFINIIPKDGYAIVNIDDKNVRDILDKPKCNIITYGINEGDVTAKNLVCNEKGAYTFDAYNKDKFLGTIS